MTTTHKRRRFTRKQLIIATIAGVVLLAPAAAYAAVLIFGFGSIAGAAPATATLSIEDATYPTEVGTLTPGSSANVKIAVKNPNSFAVSVTALHIKNGTTFNGGTAGQCAITTNGTAASFPETGGGSKKTVLSTPVTLNPNQVSYVEFPAVFTQDSSGTKLCTVNATYAVEGSVGS